MLKRASVLPPLLACLFLASLKNMSNVVLSFAKLEFSPGAELLEGLAAEALKKIRSFSPQVREGVWWRRGWGQGVCGGGLWQVCSNWNMGGGGSAKVPFWRRAGA
jgi:hypothetical protein